MFEPKVYVRCDILEVGEQDIQLTDKMNQNDDYECCISLSYTTEKTSDFFKLCIDLELRYRNQYDETKILVKLPYSFTYSLEKYEKFSLDNIKISALNEITSEVNDLYGFYLMILLQHRLKSKRKEMN